MTFRDVRREYYYVVNMHVNYYIMLKQDITNIGTAEENIRELA